jgi:hypothetical protein
MLLPALGRGLLDGILLEVCNARMYDYGLKGKEL